VGKPGKKLRQPALRLASLLKRSHLSALGGARLAQPQRLEKQLRLETCD